MKLSGVISIIFFLLGFTAFFTQNAYAIVDPLSVPNNKFGIHIIQATPDESSPAASLVDANGDWGYVTLLIESKDRNHDKWQEFFNDLRRRHLIPLVRLATEPAGNYWRVPYEGEEKAWADFLDSLNWPIKNRYIIIYNEPNHATEWGNSVDAASYAITLDKTITALKNKRSLTSSQGSEDKNSDFFVLNAGFDASAPSRASQYEDQIIFMRQMNQAVPGIFNKLDGWVSHSYPNPGFAGSPEASGRGTIRTYLWELMQLRSLGVTKDLPVFITETGWKHAEGLNYNQALPSAETVADYFKQAFANAWNNEKIVAVTPFLLSYQEAPFDHFSFKRLKQSDYYPAFQAIQDLAKVAGQPVQETKAELTKGEIYSSIVSGESYQISLTFKNTGQSIWSGSVRLVPVEGGNDLGIQEVAISKDKNIEPGQEYTFNLNLRAPLGGSYKVSLNLFDGTSRFSSKPVEFTTEVKSPVILKVMGVLGWKKDFSGDYILKIKGITGDSAQAVTLNSAGVSAEIEARSLLPDYSFNFTVEKPFYLPKSFNQTVYAGVNTLDFGTLQPDILSALFHPSEFWKLLPFSK